MDTVSPAAFDTSAAEAFGSRLLSALNDGALCLMLSIGHQTGLFDVMRERPASTSAELAGAAGLNERYVREWLGAMVTARVVSIDPATGRCTLPPEHAAFLTRATGADNLAFYARYIATLGGVEPDILQCFREGGGVPYSRFPTFHAVMEEDSGQSVLAALETHVLPLVPGLADRLAAGIDVLDLGCGRARVIRKLASLFPNSRFTGIDLSDEAIAHARERSREEGLTNVTFVQADLRNYDETAEPEAYDWITTFDAVHDQPAPLNLLRGIHRALRPDGVYLMQDIKASSHMHENLDHPIGTLLYTVSCLHCMTVSLAQGGEGLGAMWGEQKTCEYVDRAGFHSVEKHELAHDLQNNWYVIRKSPPHA
jgi:ubiquinone/menaquinone biosynthesis C-methylase UbiE